MKRILKKVLVYCFFTFLIFSIPALVKGQGPTDPGCNPDGYGRNPDGTYYVCPIDDGLYLLLILGVGYGIKKMRDSKKTNRVFIDE